MRESPIEKIVFVAINMRLQETVLFFHCLALLASHCEIELQFQAISCSLLSPAIGLKFQKET